MTDHKRCKDAELISGAFLEQREELVKLREKHHQQEARFTQADQTIWKIQDLLGIHNVLTEQLQVTNSPACSDNELVRIVKEYRASVFKE